MIELGAMVGLALTITACGSGIEPGTAAGAPAITTQPQSITAGDGATATFTVAVSGDGPLQYQWYRNSASVSGATSSVYTTGALTLDDNGTSYTVTVSNTLGQVTSQAATLSVVPSTPVIRTQPAATSVIDGNPATFTIQMNGTGPFTYQWFRVAPGAASGTAVGGATGASYTTPATSMVSDNGAKYYVVITGPGGTNTSSQAALTITARAPTVTTQPADAAVTVTGAAAFTVQVSGTAPFSYQWYRGGVAISGATSASYTTSATNYGDDAAQFNVVVTNAGGSATSQAATLSVNPSSAASTIAVNACQTISAAGAYRLSTNIVTATSPCITISASDVQLDCQNLQIAVSSGANSQAIALSGAQRASVRNCQLQAAVMNVSGGSDISLSKNTFTPPSGVDAASLSVSNVTRLTFDHNTLTTGSYVQQGTTAGSVSNNTMHAKAGASGTPAVVQSNYGAQTRVIGNTLDGQWDTTSRGSLTQNGANAGILITDESDVTVRGNTLSRVYTCGVSLAGLVTNAVVSGNTMTYMGQCGVGGSLYLGVGSSSFATNTVDNAPKLFEFYRSGGLRPAQTIAGHAVAADTAVIFKDNVFSGNALTNPQPPDTSSTIGPALIIPFYAASGTLPMSYSLMTNTSTAIPGERTPVASDFQLTNNTFTGNAFGKVADTPSFGTAPYTGSLVVDGGGNVCRASGESGYPLNCH